MSAAVLKEDRNIHTKGNSMAMEPIARTVNTSQLVLFSFFSLLNSFISFPSYKGRDGKYYSYIYFRFSEADQDEILKAVAEAL